MARLPNQLAKTALMARSSCSYGSLGKSRPVSSRTIALNSSASVAQVVGGQLGVLLDAAGVLGRLERLVEPLAASRP